MDTKKNYHKGDQHSGGGGALGGGGKKRRPQRGWEKGDIVRDVDDLHSKFSVPVKPGRDLDENRKVRPLSEVQEQSGPSITVDKKPLAPEIATAGEKMSNLTTELLSELLAVQATPCISLYQPTHRQHPENQQDTIRFGNIVKELEGSLLKEYPAADVKLLLKPFEDLVNDRDFWNHTLEGLAVLSGGSHFHTFRLPQPTAEQVVVANSFHTKPLRRFLQSVDRYQVLGLSQHDMRLFEGSRDELHEVDLIPAVPRTLTEALGEQLTDPHHTVTSHGGVGGAGSPMHHGHGGAKDEADLDADRYFRAVDRAVNEHYSRPSGLPLILAALPEHHHRFHKLSDNPHLVAQGIKFSSDSTSQEELRDLAWKIIEPQYQERLAALCEEFALARAKGLGSGVLAEAAQAAVSGRVAKLLIDADHQIGGRLNTTTGEIEQRSLNDPQVDDVLDDLGELVTKMGGTVLVIPAEQMPTKTGVAAIYRY